MSQYKMRTGCAIVLLLLAFTTLISYSLAETLQSGVICISNDASWWHATLRTGRPDLHVDLYLKLQGYSDVSHNFVGGIQFKVIEKTGPPFGVQTSIVGVELHGGYTVDEEVGNMTISSLACTTLVNSNSGMDNAAICNKFSNLFAAHNLLFTAIGDCDGVSLNGFSSSFYKKAISFMTSSDPATSCDFRGSSAGKVDNWWYTSNKRIYDSKYSVREDIFFKVESDNKKFTMSQVAYLKEGGVVDCNVNTLIATFKGNFYFNPQLSVIVANHTECQVIQGSDYPGCNLCSNGHNFFMNGPVHWLSNSTCSNWIYESGAPDSGVDVLDFSFKVTTLQPPTSESEITMLIIAIAIIACILVISVPFFFIVVRDCRRYREEKLRGGAQQI
ncbi:hypothetical protein C9374_009015 [Naegleria lovaniensis]|uniref:Uncharacterized protein n=1 Tax=Naegleria lovaniensis TaxID=51637 RepID=A0AA88GJG9_NAELO|nr:uncharacterized protein C9374_009015 [Naegleria lovaniensis]KAG2377930.1 hypothetical protein C9374_009015 [Naegleria lovaniensis]